MKPLTKPLHFLNALAILIQDFEQMHGLPDANCRSLCMLWLNHLLMKNGFRRNAKEPNAFDAFAINELIEEIMTAWQTR